jgi:hypothetical protein
MLLIHQNRAFFLLGDRSRRLADFIENRRASRGHLGLRGERGSLSVPLLTDIFRDVARLLAVCGPAPRRLALHLDGGCCEVVRLRFADPGRRRQEQAVPRDEPGKSQSRAVRHKHIEAGLADHAEDRNRLHAMAGDPHVARAGAENRLLAHRDVSYVARGDEDLGIVVHRKDHFAHLGGSEVFDPAETVVAGADVALDIHPRADPALCIPRNLGRKRRPAYVFVAGAPRNPGGSPVLSGNPAPAFAGHQPAAVVEDDAAERLAAHPSPPRVSVRPVAFRVRRPVRLDVGAPACPVAGHFEPAAVGRECRGEFAEICLRSEAAHNSGVRRIRCVEGRDSAPEENNPCERKDDRRRLIRSHKRGIPMPAVPLRPCAPSLTCL